MGISAHVERYAGVDLDTLCGYTTARTLLIRDRRLGFLLFGLQFIIFLYVVVYQVLLQQVYSAVSDFNGVVRLQLKAPAPAMRWPGGAPPYCLGVAAPLPAAYPLAPGYAIPSPGNFSRNGVPFQQRHCQFLDETTAVPIPETDRMFLTTETRATAQSAPAACANLDALNCTFAPPYNRNDDSVTRRSFVADIEYFTLLIDHNIDAFSAGIHRTGTAMRGRMLAADGKTPVNPCDEYAGFPSGCPTAATAGFDIAVGSPGLPDIVAIGTLLRAAGIGGLDSLAGLSGADAAESHREAGLVLNLDISYTNFYLEASGALGTGSLDASQVLYTVRARAAAAAAAAACAPLATHPPLPSPLSPLPSPLPSQYRVSTVASTEYKYITGESPFGNATVRENLNRHGLRILVSTSARIGYFNLMTLLINLNVAAGLMGLSYLLVDLLITRCSLAICPLRGVYRQFKERRTGDMSDLRKAAAADPRALAKLQARFESDPYVLDPTPSMLQLVAEAEERGELAAQRSPGGAWSRGGGGGGGGRGGESGAGRAGGSASTPLLVEE